MMYFENKCLGFVLNVYAQQLGFMYALMERIGVLNTNITQRNRIHRRGLQCCFKNLSFF